MQCSNCRAEIPADSVFCPSCGQKVEAAPRKCSGCGRELGPEQNFCPGCGSKVQGSEAPPVPVGAAQTVSGTAAPTRISTPSQSVPSRGMKKEKKKGMSPWIVWLSVGCLVFVVLCVAVSAVAVIYGGILGPAKGAAESGATQTPQAVQTDVKSTPVPTTVAAKPTATSGGPTTASSTKVQNAKIGLGLDSQQSIINPTTAIKPTTPEVFLSTEVWNVSQKTTVEVQWVHVDSKSVINGPQQIVFDDSRLGFSLTKPTAGWPTGKYQAVILVNGQESATLDFTCAQ